MYGAWFCHIKVIVIYGACFYLLIFFCCIFAQALPMCSTGGSDFQFGASERQTGLEMPRCFLSSSPENTLTAQTSPVVSSLPNGPLNKVTEMPLLLCYGSAQIFVLCLSSCVVLVSLSGLACLHPAICIQSSPQGQRATSL